MQAQRPAAANQATGLRKIRRSIIWALSAHGKALGPLRRGTFPAAEDLVGKRCGSSPHGLKLYLARQPDSLLPCKLESDSIEDPIQTNGSGLDAINYPLTLRGVYALAARTLDRVARYNVMTSPTLHPTVPNPVLGRIGIPPNL